MPSATAAFVDATGIHAPTYADVLAYLQDQYRAIYGADVYLGNDSQDGQLLAIFALAISDANAAAIAVYNSFSPATAQGVGLSSVVKINGLTREVATVSTVPLLITGDPGTIIVNGYATDANFNQWNLPQTVVVPTSGQITVSASAGTIGAVAATAGTIRKIGTPTRGWQAVTNPSAAVAGNPIESDATLRQRQAASTMQPAITATEALVGAVEAVPGVKRLRLYENDTAVTDTNGVPSHSIALVVEGGDPQTIANALFSKKTPGAGTFGTTSLTVVDTYGVPNTIRFFLPIFVPITVAIVLTPLTGYTTDVGAAVQAAVINYLNALPIGQSVILSRLYVPANSAGAVYNLVSVSISRGAATPGAANVLLAFNEVATADTSSVSVTIG